MKKVKFIYLNIVSLIIGIILLPTLVCAIEWKQVPLRTVNQKIAGLMGGEGMQMIQSMAYAPSNPQVVYLVSDTSQVWKSIDGGKTWSMKHKGFIANGGLSVAVDPLNENIALIAGSVGWPINRYKPTDPLCGIFRTKDGGESWKLVKKTFYFKREIGDNGGRYFAFITKASDKKYTNTIYAGTYNDGLLKSTDSGDNWSLIGLEGKNIYDIRLNPQNQFIVYIATTQGLYRYDDNFGKINKIGIGLPDYPRTIAVNPKDPNIIYAAVGKHGVYMSMDGGLNFSERNKGLPKGEEYIHISLSPANPEYLYVSINKSRKLNPFWSHDSGKSWNVPKTIDQGKLSLVGEHRFFSGQIEPNPKYFDIALTAANGKARILKTMDGGINWFYSSEGYTGGRLGVGKTSLAFSNDAQKMVFFLIDHGPALTTDGGEKFQILDIPRLSAETTPVGAVSPSPGSNLIVTAIGDWGKQSLAISGDNGKNWKVFPETEDRYKFIAFHPQKPNIIYAQGFISKDSGNSWKKLQEKIYAVFRANSDIVYSIDIIDKNKYIIKRSNDQGESWTISYPELPVETKAINEIDIDPLNSNRIYVASNEGFYIYNDKNKKWVKKGEESGLTKDYFGLMSFKCVAVDPKHPEVVYAGKWAPGKGHSNGIFRSINYGKTWENITYNLGPEFTAWSITVSPHDGTVYVGSSHGTWKLPTPYISQK